MMLSPLLKSHISHKRIQLKVKLIVTIHCLTESCELIDLLRAFRLGLSSKNIKSLYSSLTHEELRKMFLHLKLLDLKEI